MNNFLKEMEEMGVKVVTIDPGETVLCDLCNKDYTYSEKKGGFLFLSNAVCPDCAKDFIEDIKLNKEEKFIKASAQEGETFRDFVYRVREQF